MSRAESAQGVDEVADRPLVHARHAGDAIRPPANASAAVSGRSAVPALPRKRSADFSGNAPPAPRARGRLGAPPRTPRPAARARSSMWRVSSESSRSRTTVSPVGERCQQEDAVRDALRARQAHAPARARDRADVQVLHGLPACARRRRCCQSRAALAEWRAKGDRHARRTRDRVPESRQGAERPRGLPRASCGWPIWPSRSASSRSGASSTTSPTTRCARTCCSS